MYRSTLVLFFLSFITFAQSKLPVFGDSATLHWDAECSDCIYLIYCTTTLPFTWEYVGQTTNKEFTILRPNKKHVIYGVKVVDKLYFDTSYIHSSLDITACMIHKKDTCYESGPWYAEWKNKSATNLSITE